jgi:putative hydrolase of the HAD superfamily
MAPDLNNFIDSSPSATIPEREPAADGLIWPELRREIRAISLDLWGTILDDKQAPSDTILHSEVRQNFLRAELQRCGHQISSEQLRAAYRHAWEYFDDLWARQIAFDAKDGLQAMLRHLTIELPEENFERVRRYFEEVHQSPQPLDGTLEAVQQLAKKYPLALISDTAWTPGRVLRQIFARYGIRDCFRALIFSGEVGVTKPHPQMFQLALDGLGVEPPACLHIGDLQRTDIAGAKAVGMHTAWIRRPVYAGEGQRNHEPDVVVKDVYEVAANLLR